MAHEVIKRLFSSFDELENSINIAKKALSIRVPIQHAVLQRLANYEDILSKQRRLAEKLCEHIMSSNWQEVNRHIRLINGLSALIYGDAKELSETILADEQPSEMLDAKLAN
jgi:hypothetical protein